LVFWLGHPSVRQSERSFGEIVRFVEASPSDKAKKVFKKRYPISASQALQLRRLIDSLQIEALPSAKNIKGWQQGLDGITYFTKYKKAGGIQF
jgi:hypothetical protein